MLVLSDNMSIERVKTREGCIKGQEINFNRKDIYVGINDNFFKQVIAVLSVIVVIVISFSALTIQGEANEVKAVISIDINPSIELNIGADGKIISINRVNRDAQTLNFKSLEGEYLSKGIEVIIIAAQNSDYLNYDSTILITKVMTDGLLVDLSEQIEEIKDINKKSYNIVVIEKEVEDISRFINAEDRNISVGKQILNDGLNLSEDEINAISVEELIILAVAIDEEIIEAVEEAEEREEDKVEAAKKREEDKVEAAKKREEDKVEAAEEREEDKTGKKQVEKVAEKELKEQVQDDEITNN